MDDSVRTFNNQSHEMKGILFHADYTLAKINEDDICSNFKTKYEGVLMDESEDDICSIFQTKYAELYWTRARTTFAQTKHAGAFLRDKRNDICSVFSNKICRSFAGRERGQGEGGGQSAAAWLGDRDPGGLPGKSLRKSSRNTLKRSVPKTESTKGRGRRG